MSGGGVQQKAGQGLGQSACQYTNADLQEAAEEFKVLAQQEIAATTEIKELE